MTNVVLIILAAYLLGSIPFGYLIPLFWQVDIRQQGSGNVGATNVFRTLGPLPGSIVFALDMAKGTLPILLAQNLTNNPWLIILTGFVAIIGHTFPVFLGFKGGRGVATGLGVLLGIAPEIFIGAVIIAALIILTTRYVSLASMVTAALVTIAFWGMQKPLPYTILAALVALLIIIRHRPNIKRLLAGTEAKISRVIPAAPA